ncbi:transcription-repair coupling factor [Solemya velum gill symbiont]|uniref:Transcription-repair-coupling factor n=3 Tax=Solemya velum gill symbiont TaxID=2340 RepID=A0A1T2N528_SOVGS|nr:transcription-repair coupling factor [Solemya velum gill symbiont]OOY34262.1 transcription-repair coupling factor [Solemya velum gill symbiont]OOY37035.1 transcription-repair coupling factor [Solemya velum gill symbiont]OOY40252.1 transcription-repair coupling factor [Solemya velum gill symbiont]OOY46319.1 transcription-repair coupling factor [Solemya velum gill symbiont]OOY47356.1 transcription-repair coupling factor [Solemya velum gill symbiont]
MSQDSGITLDQLTLPQRPGERILLGAVRGCMTAMLLASAARDHDGLVIAVTDDIQQAIRLEQDIRFFCDAGVTVTLFPDRETLPYDVFSPLPELISQRLKSLHAMPGMQRGIIILPINTLMQRLPPPSYVQQNTLFLKNGQQVDFEALRRNLEQSGYRYVSQVMEHGEFSVRGSLIDLFPMGSSDPYRIDLFDDEIDSIRTFDPETQRTRDKVDAISMLPAREFPTDEKAIEGFRQRYRETIEQDFNSSLIYREVSEGRFPGGIDYYMPLFFEETATLFDYFPDNSLMLLQSDFRDAAANFDATVSDRYEQRRHDIERPILPPRSLFLDDDELANRLKQYASVLWQSRKADSVGKGIGSFDNFTSRTLPPLGLNARASRPAGLLQDFLDGFSGRVLFTAESAGRREQLSETLASFSIHPQRVDNWDDFTTTETNPALTIAPLEQGIVVNDLAIVPETALLGERVRQPGRKKSKSDSDQIIRNLTELHEGAPVVHEDHGIGRFMGLQTIDVGGEQQEFLALQYSGKDKLYVPVSALHLISRYSGASPENAPLHKLGTDTWEKAKRKAAQKAHDVAAELLDIYARREASRGVKYPQPGDEYAAFAAAFEFETTPDQQSAIDSILDDMESPRPMDRVVCGDVGFGKTEVAMRAAFHAAINGKQVAVLVPTTLLAQQHFTNFIDRFADWPIEVEGLSRFRTAKEQKAVLAGLEDGSVDIVVGTHAILKTGIKFKNLGLVIIDEEHRFGVRHKERLKSLRAEVDMLTLTATPIPRTLNMAMSSLRDLSIIATPPVERHPIKTFISQWNDNLIQEAIRREIGRGGQLYFLHNEVSTIDNMAQKIEALVPEVKVEVAHGQMRERDLERVMRDFYHQRFQILVCTTIVESGIDVHTANTIIINRADKLGLAQLHQLRGRVGRSHHRAYAYMLAPPQKSITADAKKRLEAIESLEDLGAGFTLATHDLEIRGAGELLGDEQSGQIAEVGYALYTELLERAVKAIRKGEQPELDRPLDHGAEIDLGLPALIPADYLPDVHMRLVQYKRIASAETTEELRELQVEMIDRFGLLPDPLKNLFAATRLKLRIQTMGIRKLDASASGARIQFDEDPKIDFAHIIRLIQTEPDRFKLEGQDKLRFTADFDDPLTRVDKLESLLARLQNK